jgi:hypothetical protein
LGKLKHGDLVINKFDYDSPVTIKYGINEVYRKTKSLSEILLGKQIVELPTETIEKYKEKK